MLRRSVSKLTGAFKCPQLDALAAHINKDPARAVCFHRHYTGKFKDMAAEDDRAVLFFTPKCVESCEKRQVPIKYDPSLFAGGRDVDWSKLVVVNGPTGSGKTCFGLFGLTKPEQLLVYVSVPPRIDKLKVSDVSPRVGEWISCAEQNQRLYDSGDMLENHSLSYYDAALRHYVLDCLEARIGKRVNVHDDDTVEVVFFFDKFYSGSDVVQHGVRDIAATWREKGVLCELSKTLRDDYGLELSGVAVVGAGLDLNALAQSPNLLTPRTDQLSWCQLTSHPFEKDEQVPLHVQAELDAAVQLPRLAALILQRATARCGEDQPLTMTALYEGLLIAVRAFARLSALSGLARNEAKRHEVGRLCLRMLLLARDYPMPSCDTATDEVRDDDTHAVVVRYGLAVLTPPKRNVPSRSMYRDIAFGPAQRLLLRHFFGVSKHSPTGTATHAADFKLALAEFLCRAAAAFCGITVDKLLSSLKEFFSPPVQTRFKSNYWAPRIDEIPKEWPGYFIRADTGAVVHLHKRAADSQLEVPPRQVTVLVNTADSDLPWDLQLVLPVTRKEDGTEVEFATINVNTTQCLSMPPSEMVQFKHEQVKIQANAPAVVRGAHRRCGFIPVFGRPNALCWGWQVDVADPGSLVVVPFRAWSPSETGSSVPASAPGGVTPM